MKAVRFLPEAGQQFLADLPPPTCQKHPMLLLIEPADSPSSCLDTPGIELCGRRWALQRYATPSDAPRFTCISYAWEKDRVAHPFDPCRQMSARTIAAIETVIQSAQSPANWAGVQINRDPQKDAAAKAEAQAACHAFWIDALCVPLQGPARTACLQSMGEIYSAAWQVFAVLPESCTPLFRQIRTAGNIDADGLSVLEMDEWITRAWTYQEAVNSQALYFVGQGHDGWIVSGTDFLNIVLTANDARKEALQIDAATWSAQHPKLDCIENLVADYRIADYSNRSAYQVMVALHPRTSEREDDHFYAMVGAVSHMALGIDGAERLSPSGFFMRVCETKGDFSFLYNTAPRDAAAGKRWCPQEGKFPPVVPGLLSFGDGQPGSAQASHLQLDKMCRLKHGTLSPAGLKSTLARLPKGSTFPDVQALAEALLAWLKKKGFSGCGDYVELESGFFFPQLPLAAVRSENVFVAVGVGVQWLGGGPGMLLCSNGSGIDDFLCVGAFVGRMPDGQETICVG